LPMTPSTMTDLPMTPSTMTDLPMTPQVVTDSAERTSPVMLALLVTMHVITVMQVSM
jgi:hypothetical protein